MPSPFLAMRDQSGSTPRVVSYAGATPTVIGTAVGTAQTYEAAAWPYTNRTLNFNGLLIASSAGNISYSRDDGYSWTTAYTFSPQTTLSPIIGPVAITDSDGTTTALIVWTNLSGQFNVTRSTDGINWTNTVRTDLVGRLSWSTVANNALYCYDTFSSNVIRVPATSGAPSNFTQTLVRYLVTWQGMPYSIDIVSNNLRLGLITGSYTAVATISALGSYSNDHTYAAWVDPTTGELIVVARTGSAGANNWKAFSIATDYTVTERTATMLTGGALDGFGTTSKVVGVVYDQIDAVGSSPTISLYIASNPASGSAVSQFRYNGIGSRMGDGSGNANASGGSVNDSFPNQNIDSTRNWVPRSLDPTETTGTPYSSLVGVGAPIINGIRVEFQAITPRTVPLDTVGGSPATYNLATNPIPSTPIRPFSVAIHGTISGTVQVALDDGAGAFPVSTLLPSGGTINYDTGAMTGATATLDAATDVRAYWAGGTASVQFFRTLATDSYPADAITSTVNPAPLSNPTQGTISGDTNVNVPADGTTCQVDIGMTGFTSGDSVSIEPYVF